MIEIGDTDANTVRNCIPMRNYMPASAYGLKAISDWFHFTSNSGYQTLKSTNQSYHLINPPRPPKHGWPYSEMDEIRHRNSDLWRHFGKGSGTPSYFSWKKGLGLRGDRTGVAQVTGHCPYHYASSSACKNCQNRLILNYISNFLQIFAKYCKILQITYLGPPIVIFNLSCNLRPILLY